MSIDELTLASPVGLAQPLFRLRESFARARSGMLVVVTIRGVLGSGKTTLLRTFSDECRVLGSIVTTADCGSQPYAPHAALVDIVDVLRAHLFSLSPHDARRLLTPDLAFIAQLVPSFESIVDMIASQPDVRAMEKSEQRIRAMAALRRLLGALGKKAPAVVMLDNAHRIDADSATLLEQLLDEGGPPLLFITTTENDSNDDPLILRNIVTPRGQRNVGHQTIRLERGAGMESIEDVMAHRMSARSAKAVSVLNVLAISACRLRKRDLEAILEGPVDSALAEAREKGFVSIRGDDEVWLAHEVLRKIVQRSETPEQNRLWHEKLARALESTDAPVGAIAYHYDMAGATIRRRAYFERAADIAANVLAYDLAANLYARALNSSPDANDVSVLALLQRLAESLVAAGRSIEAGETFARLAGHTSGAASMSLREKAAHAYLRGGYVEAAVSGLRDLLARAGLPYPDRRGVTLLRVAWRHATRALHTPQFVPRAAQEIDPETIERIDLVWSVIGGLGNLDPLLGAYYQQKHLELALASGDPLRASRALAADAAFTAAEGTTLAPTVSMLLDRAKRLLEEQACAPYWHGILSMMRGESAFFCGDFRAATESLAHAEMIFSEQCSGVGWELLATQSYKLYSLFYLGRFRELRIEEARARRVARAYGDVHALAMLRPIHVATALADGDMARAFSELAGADQNWALSGLHVHHFIDMRLRAEIALYQGDARTAHAEVRKRLPQFPSSMLKHVQIFRVEAMYLQGRCSLAMMESGANRGPHRKAVEKAIASLRHEHNAWADALATLLEAGADARRSDIPSASKKLDAAVAQFEALGMVLHAAISRRRRSELNADRGGVVPVHVVDRFLIENQGLKSPACVAAILAPGFT